LTSIEVSLVDKYEFSLVHILSILVGNALVEVIESSNPYYPFTSTSIGAR
jgi:hypothetical protein